MIIIGGGLQQELLGTRACGLGTQAGAWWPGTACAVPAAGLHVHEGARIGQAPAARLQGDQACDQVNPDSYSVVQLTCTLIVENEHAALLS